MSKKQKCSVCGCLYDEDDARDMINAEYGADGITYEENGVGMCYNCAKSNIESLLEEGARVDFSLETGRPPEEMPWDWDPSEHD